MLWRDRERERERERFLWTKVWLRWRLQRFLSVEFYLFPWIRICGRIIILILAQGRMSKLLLIRNTSVKSCCRQGSMCVRVGTGTLNQILVSSADLWNQGLEALRISMPNPIIGIHLASCMKDICHQVIGFWSLVSHQVAGLPSRPLWQSLWLMGDNFAAFFAAVWD